ncbi:hemagglutinin/amebocyte aggregation factor-like [Hyla sarda]|uniref:hemagglutinin/amebocyte aggregation factor-like n=1 Tax=Hyla sarda TaxID=327740 RepID=UPI0024C298CE|nr:hemagglutinin/amebocyte aggregation factor-like [Hyla sarda]
MSSYHDDGQEDRRWSFFCCRGKVQRRNCQWSSYVNDFEQEFTWKASSSRYLVGISSYYDNEHKDRSWTFATCEK